MRLLLIILFLSHMLYPRSQYHGCIENNNNNRNACYLRSDYLPETYLSKSGHFMIHYDNNPESDDAPDLTDTLSFDYNAEFSDYSIVIEGNNIPDYIEQVGIIADSTRYILTDIMGFHKEIDDEDGKYDIYVLDLASTSCQAYGWNRNDPQDSPTNSSYMQIDNNFIEEDGIFYSYGIKAMRVTVAHEFFHAIQKFYDYDSGDDGYFYEFTSMWIEDVIVPDGNDYLYFLDNFFTNPEQKFSKTNGYSVALYGHYLSNIIEEVQDGDETLSSIIRKTWERFALTPSPENPPLNPVQALDEVLSDFNTSFIESWVDFCSRNFHNGQFPNINDKEIYYYIDQTSTVLDELGIENANLHIGHGLADESTDTLSLIPNDNLLEFELDSLSIKMHSIVIDSAALLAMTYLEDNFPSFGQYIIAEVESPIIDNAKIEDLSSISNPILLTENNIIHFVYAGSGVEIIGVTSEAFYLPSIPDIISVSNIDEGIEIIWNPSEGEGMLEYNIYRNTDFLDQTSNTYYIDTNIDPNQEYIYNISCVNSVGESDWTEDISITSWPLDSDVTNTKIISLYPNPIYRPGISNFNLIVDYGSDIDNVDIKIFNLNGEEVLFRNLGSRDQGRSEEFLGPFLSANFVSGIYFMHIMCDNTMIKQKFTILK